MKKAVLAMFLALLSFSMVSAIDISLSKSAYYPGETLQATISGNFIDTVTADKIGIYREGAVHEAPAESGLIKSSDKYLFYAVLPEALGNYTLKIENVRYYENNLQKNAPLTQNFTIVSTNSSYLSFYPGVISATGDFLIRVKSYNSDQQVSAEFLATGQKENFELREGREKAIYFSISGITSFTKSSVNINSYNIQAIISPPFQQNVSGPVFPLSEMISLSPKKISATLLPGRAYSFNIEISNLMAEPIEDIELSSPSKKIYISPASINSLDEQEVVNVTISSAESFNSSIELTYKNSSVNFPVTIAITSNESGVSTNIPIINQGNSCASLGGKLCNFLGGEECVGTQKSTLDGICCIGSCAAPSSATKAWLWGLVILVLVAVGGWYLYRKQKLMPKSAKPGELIKKRTEQFKERMLQDQHKAPEVKKSLTKI